MCVFHDALQSSAVDSTTLIVVALSGFEKGCDLLNQLSSADIPQPELPALQSLVKVAQDPYRYLRELTRFEAEVGNGPKAVEALQRALSQPGEKYFYNPAPISEATKDLLRSDSIEQAIKAVALAGHPHREVFLNWFLENPCNPGDSVALHLLETIAREALSARPASVKLALSCCHSEEPVLPARPKDISGLTQGFKPQPGQKVIDVGLNP